MVLVFLFCRNSWVCNAGTWTAKPKLQCQSLNLQLDAVSRGATRFGMKMILTWQSNALWALRVVYYFRHKMAHISKHVCQMVGFHGLKIRRPSLHPDNAGKDIFMESMICHLLLERKPPFQAWDWRLLFKMRADTFFVLLSKDKAAYKSHSLLTF